MKNSKQKIARLYITIQTPVTNNAVICTLPQTVWSSSNVVVNALAYQNGNIGRVSITLTGGNGNIVASAIQYNETISYVNAFLEWPTAS